MIFKNNSRHCRIGCCHSDLCRSQAQHLPSSAVKVIVQAPPDKIFPLINDLRNWKRWEPQDADPTMKRTFSGPDYGVGAASDWSGKGRTGAGRMTISESKPLRSVTIDVDWRRPFTVRNVNQFTLEPDGTGTRVTWSMYGPNV